MSSSASSISNTTSRSPSTTTDVSLTRLPEDILSEIFVFVGPKDMISKVEPTCQFLNKVSQKCLELWKFFITCEYSLEDNMTSMDWRSLYIYITNEYYRQKQQQQVLPLPSNHKVHDTETMDDVATLVGGKVLFADDGQAYAGYEATNVLRDNGIPWCTGTHVTENVDLVLQLDQFHLVTRFSIATADSYYTAPLKHLLVFTSLQTPPNVNHARIYDTNQQGFQWVQKLVTQQKQQQKQRQQQQQKRQQHNRDTPQQTHKATNSNKNTTYNINNDIDNSMDIDSSDESIDNSTPPTTSLNEDISMDTRISNHNHNHSHKTLGEQTYTPNNNNNNNTKQNIHSYQPVVAFQVPELPHCYSYQEKIILEKPILCRYVHFKLLDSYHPENVYSTNIDIQDLHTYGIPLPQLSSFFVNNPCNNTQTDTSTKNDDPSYHRIHKLRPNFWAGNNNNHNHHDWDPHYENSWFPADTHTHTHTNRTVSGNHDFLSNV